jgi:DNA-binding beta-propeller fold protein YncE
VGTLSGRGSAMLNAAFDWALYSSPHGVVVTADGTSAFVADYGNSQIRLLDMTASE